MTPRPIKATLSVWWCSKATPTSTAPNRTKSIGAPSSAGVRSAAHASEGPNAPTTPRTARRRVTPRAHNVGGNDHTSVDSQADQFRAFQRVAQDTDRRDVHHRTVDGHRTESRRFGLRVRRGELARALDLLARRRERYV